MADRPQKNENDEKDEKGKPGETEADVEKDVKKAEPRREHVVVKGSWHNGNLMVEMPGGTWAYVYVVTPAGRYCLLKQTEAGFPNSTNSKVLTLTLLSF